MLHPTDSMFESAPAAIEQSGEFLFIAQDISNFTFFALSEGIDAVVAEGDHITKDLSVRYAN